MLETSGLAFRYRSAGSYVFRDLSVQFPSGAMTAVTGASGAGKSTLLYILGLLQKPTAGQVLLDGETISDLPDGVASGRRARLFGFVFQDAQLDTTRSILDNVLEPAFYAREKRSSKTVRALRLLDELGLGLPPQQRASKISGGQAQRVALCRALLLDPGVILADEPTGNLDEVSSQIVINRLKNEAASGRVVVVVSHDLHVVEQADSVIDLLRN